MKINCSSYSILVSPNETVLVNIGKKVTLFSISNKNLNKRRQFYALKHASRAALSSDGKMLAYINTSGHIAVHNIDTGELLVKSKCLNIEGYSLYFINDDKQIISSAWNGNVFVLDIKSGKTTVVNSFPFHKSTNLVPISYNNFIVISPISSGETFAYDFTVKNNKAIFSELFSSYSYRIKSLFFSYSEDEVLFFGSNINNSSDKWLSEDIAENVLFLYNISTKEFSPIASIQELLGINCSLSEYGYFTSICISKNKQYVLVGLSQSIIIIDLLNKKHINTVKTKYLSSLHFVKFDTEVIIGTWINIQIIDFQKLCQMKQC